MMEEARRYLTVPRLGGISGLVHGFGTAEWSEEDFSGNEGFREFSPVIMNQVHSETVHRVEAAPRERLDGDALVTGAPGLLLVVKTADCLPALIVDEARKAVAAVHCGWRSTRRDILGGTVAVMRRTYGSEPESLLAALGPCIGSDCYEVGPEVRAEFEAAGFPAGVFRKLPEEPGRHFLDLRQANIWLLGRAGLREDNILSVDTCTHCDPRLLSYRRDKDKERRMFSFIGLRK